MIINHGRYNINKRIDLASFNASIVTVGDELLIGQVVNTNAVYLAGELTRIGITVSYTMTVQDDVHAITAAIQDGVKQCDLTIVTGGLGPTPDDLTREAAAQFAGVSLYTDPNILEALQQRFALLGRSVPHGSERVASVPEGFETLSNAKGTAPGLLHQTDQGPLVVLLPGVPHEMKSIFSHHVIPRILQSEGRLAMAQRTLNVAGIGETVVQQHIDSITDQLDTDLKIAYLPGIYGVRVRLTLQGEDAELRICQVERSVQQQLGEAIFGCDEDSLQSVLGNLLRDQSMTIAVAESCTGGSVLDHLTNVPGSSDYVLGGVVAYSNSIKKHQLGVNRDALDQFGAVSESVALQMAEGVRDRFGSDVGLSVTGISGPSGGSPDKPVGLVWIGYADQHSSWAVKRQFGNDRAMNKAKSALAVLDLARKALLKRNKEHRGIQ